jgi:hypothetical protein
MQAEKLDCPSAIEHRRGQMELSIAVPVIGGRHGDTVLQAQLQQRLIEPLNPGLVSMTESAGMKVHYYRGGPIRFCPPKIEYAALVRTVRHVLQIRLASISHRTGWSRAQLSLETGRYKKRRATTASDEGHNLKIELSTELNNALAGAWLSLV